MSSDIFQCFVGLSLYLELCNPSGINQITNDGNEHIVFLKWMTCQNILISVTELINAPIYSGNTFS